MRVFADIAGPSSISPVIPNPDAGQPSYSQPCSPSQDSCPPHRQCVVDPASTSGVKCVCVAGIAHQDDPECGQDANSTNSSTAVPVSATQAAPLPPTQAAPLPPGSIGVAPIGTTADGIGFPVGGDPCATSPCPVELCSADTTSVLGYTCVCADGSAFDVSTGCSTGKAVGPGPAIPTTGKDRDSLILPSTTAQANTSRTPTDLGDQPHSSTTATTPGRNESSDSSVGQSVDVCAAGLHNCTGPKENCIAHNLSTANRSEAAGFRCVCQGGATPHPLIGCQEEQSKASGNSSSVAGIVSGIAGALLIIGVVLGVRQFLTSQRTRCDSQTSLNSEPRMKSLSKSISLGQVKKGRAPTVTKEICPNTASLMNMPANEDYTQLYAGSPCAGQLPVTSSSSSSKDPNRLSSGDPVYVTTVSPTPSLLSRLAAKVNGVSGGHVTYGAMSSDSVDSQSTVTVGAHLARDGELNEVFEDASTTEKWPRRPPGAEHKHEQNSAGTGAGGGGDDSRKTALLQKFALRIPVRRSVSSKSSSEDSGTGSSVGGGGKVADHARVCDICKLNSACCECRTASTSRSYQDVSPLFTNQDSPSMCDPSITCLEGRLSVACNAQGVSTASPNCNRRKNAEWKVPISEMDLALDSDCSDDQSSGIHSAGSGGGHGLDARNSMTRSSQVTMVSESVTSHGNTAWLSPSDLTEDSGVTGGHNFGSLLPSHGGHRSSEVVDPDNGEERTTTATMTTKSIVKRISRSFRRHGRVSTDSDAPSMGKNALKRESSGTADFTNVHNSANLPDSCPLEIPAGADMEAFQQMLLAEKLQGDGAMYDDIDSCTAAAGLAEKKVPPPLPPPSCPSNSLDPVHFLSASAPASDTYELAVQAEQTYQVYAPCDPEIREPPTTRVSICEDAYAELVTDSPPYPYQNNQLAGDDVGYDDLRTHTFHASADSRGAYANPDSPSMPANAAVENGYSKLGADNPHSDSGVYDKLSADRVPTTTAGLSHGKL
eukprot:scpid30986/ scgid4460/ 